MFLRNTPNLLSFFTNWPLTHCLFFKAGRDWKMRKQPLGRWSLSVSELSLVL
jgi:hypothetical protein